MNSHGSWREGAKGNASLSMASPVGMIRRGAVRSATSLKTPLIVMLIVLAAV